MKADSWMYMYNVIFHQLISIWFTRYDQERATLCHLLILLPADSTAVFVQLYCSYIICIEGWGALPYLNSVEGGRELPRDWPPFLIFSDLILSYFMPNSILLTQPPFSVAEDAELCKWFTFSAEKNRVVSRSSYHILIFTSYTCS